MTRDGRTDWPVVWCYLILIAYTIAAFGLPTLLIVRGLR